VFSNPKWQKAALGINLAGTAILFFSFQATSSDIKLVTAPSKISPTEKQYAICADGRALIISSGDGVAIGMHNCPNWENARPAAVVNIEHPTFVGIGFGMILLGFLLQYFAVPQPETVAHLRRQLKEAKVKAKTRISN